MTKYSRGPVELCTAFCRTQRQAYYSIRGTFYFPRVPNETVLFFFNEFFYLFSFISFISFILFGFILLFSASVNHTERAFVYDNVLYT